MEHAVQNLIVRLEPTMFFSEKKKKKKEVGSMEKSEKNIMFIKILPMTYYKTGKMVSQKLSKICYNPL